MARPIPPLILTTEQEAHLQLLAKSRAASYSLVQRSQIILKASQGISNKAIGKALNLNEDAVGLWRKRWLEHASGLEKLTAKHLGQALEQVLSDRPRSGSPVTFTAEQVCQLIALACEKPPDHMSQWTQEELARTAIKRGIVKSISPSSIGRFLKSSRPKTSPQPVLAES